MKLTEKQRRLINAIVEVGEKVEAARRAGYTEASAKDAPNWFNPNKHQYKPYLKEALEKRLLEMDAEKVADGNEVMQFLTTVMRGELQEEVVTSEGTVDGQSRTKIVKKQVCARDRLDAAKQIARRYGLDKLVVEQKTDDRIQIIMPPRGDPDDGEAD
ncbi:MAG: terminase small subunit [Veillonellaceae bacterium]|nr:terminase small subunit [Veillonellaceae bacterium]